MFTIEEILKATKGKLLSNGKKNRAKSVSTDSRTIKPGTLFVPLIGKNYDGHKFIPVALKKGAVGTLTSKRTKLPKGKAAILVKDTEKAFQQLAKAYKERFKARFVGITGSSGKTTTKDMLASILALAGKTLKTEENYNNEIGVPLTLFKLTKKHKFCVIEMAMQGIGEIDELAEIVRPNISMIINIGEAHIGLLKSKNAIARTKSEILNYNKRSDISVLPSDDTYFDFLKKKSKCKVLTFGLMNKADVEAREIVNKKNGISFNLIYKGKKTQINLPIPGIHNVYDALAATAAAFALKIKLSHIKRGLEKFILSSKRVEIIHKKGIRIINDSYNANPSSMRSSLEILQTQLPVIGKKPPRRIAVLGGMLELGKFTNSGHIKTGRLAAKLGIDKLYTVGKLGKVIALGAKHAGMKDIFTTANNQEAIEKIRSSLKPNDVILIKGSRSMRMEEIAEGLKKHA
ncbi:UDP-N-acetylmuramoyl-tripeptide--D-alanyl-D-alanine ligase [Candidatus Margulisiibacteriota bacterium]